VTFSADEKTVHSGQPIELYDFILTGGDSAAYYYTDYHSSLTVLGHTYLPQPIRRGKILATDIEEAKPLNIELPYTTPLLADIAFKMPPRSIEVEVRRYHGSIANVSLIWKGRVQTTRVKNRLAVISVISMWSAQLQTAIPAIGCSTTCRYVLYGGQCDPGGTLRAAHTDSTTISAIDSTDSRIITVGSLSGPAGASAYKGGEVIRTTDGERRLITNRSGTQLTVVRPFRNLAVSDAVSVAEGCTHQISTCASQFSNIANYGGEPYIQATDLYRRGVWADGPYVG